MLKKVLIVAGALLVLLIAFNIISAERHAYAAGQQDERNRPVTIYAYHQFGVNPNSLVIDLRSVDAGGAPADVMRYVFQIAERMKDRSFSEVRLAYRGETRFILPGERFKIIGREHGQQNPLFVIQTLPQDLMRPDGTRAYSRWEGGWLGVATNQMRDFTDFTAKWFLNDETARR